ncbi:MAG: GspH/FimT family pseudopilin [Chromatiales bacterium]|nr:GspH/FimT family pseudopilin [Chromatiales bacterium]
MKTNTGFTLIELLVTVTIAGILLTLAVPSFNETIRNNRLTTQANDLVSTFNLARSEAIKRRTNVQVCTSNNQAACTNTPWTQGWIVLDQNNNLIRVFGPMRGNINIGAGAPNTITYNQFGLLAGAGVTLRLCAGAAKPGRTIEVTATGRPANLNPFPLC